MSIITRVNSYSRSLMAAAGPNALIVGPPGAGKTLLARAMPGIMPSLRGLLFLDELPEFGQRTLEVLRQPLDAQEGANRSPLVVPRAR